MATTALDAFLDMCCTEVERRAERPVHEADVLRLGARAFRRAITTMTETEQREPLASVPVLAALRDMTPSPLADAAIAAASEIPWEAAPQLDDRGQTVGLGRIPQVREFGDLECGLMLIGAGAAYPEHHHAPQEIYLPIAGNGQWRCGGALDYRGLDEHELVYNHPHDIHAVKAGNEVLLAMFILWP